MTTCWKLTIALAIFVLVVHMVQGQFHYAHPNIHAIYNEPTPPQEAIVQNTDEGQDFWKNLYSIPDTKTSSNFEDKVTTKSASVPSAEAAKPVESKPTIYSGQVEETKQALKATVLPELESITPIIDPRCKGLTFCEDLLVKNYPTDAVKEAIRKNRNVGLIPTMDKMPTVAKLRKFEQNPIEIPLCNRTEMIVYPRAALNAMNEWSFIVNEEDFRQGIRIELCEDIGNPCRLLNPVATTFKSRCKQNFVLRQLVAYEDGKMSTVNLRFPVSCGCYVTMLHESPEDSEHRQPEYISLTKQ